MPTLSLTLYGRCRLCYEKPSCRLRLGLHLLMHGTLFGGSRRSPFRNREIDATPASVLRNEPIVRPPTGGAQGLETRPSLGTVSVIAIGLPETH